MAHAHGLERTNHFRVKDEEAFTTWAAALGLSVNRSREEPDRFAISGYETDDGLLQAYDEATEEFMAGDDLAQEICDTHLPAGEVLILMGCCSENDRYASGWAVAYTPGKPLVALELQGIYQKAATAFDVPVEDITHARL